MIFSFTSLLTTMLFSSVLIAVFWYLLKCNRLVRLIGINTLFSIIAVISFRFLIPAEYFFSFTIAIKKIYPTFVLFFYDPIFQIGSSKITFLHILVFIWGIGIVVSLAKTITAYYRFRNNICNHQSAANQVITDSVTKVLKKYKRSAKFAIIQSKEVVSPILMGALSPIIVLPQIELSEIEWRYILEHEIAHYYHGDLWIKIVGEALCVLYWWNPFAYLLRKQISKTLEIRSDLTATNYMDELERVNYLTCILKIAKIGRGNRNKNMGLTFFSRTSTLLQRFSIVLDSSEPWKETEKRHTRIILFPVWVLMVASFIFIFEPSYFPPELEETTFSLSPETDYLIQDYDHYDLYKNGQYFGIMNEIKDGLSVYKNIDEVYGNEENCNACYHFLLCSGWFVLH